MSAKARFLNKLQQQQLSRHGFANRGQADIAEFCQRMNALMKQMEEWLVQTGIRIESHAISLSECLIGGEVFSVSEIGLHYQNRIITFTPVFLYAQGVTGGVDVTLCADGKMVPLRRLFMRSAGNVKTWTSIPAGKPASVRTAFTEETFFETIECLLSE